MSSEVVSAVDEKTSKIVPTPAVDGAASATEYSDLDERVQKDRDERRKDIIDMLSPFVSSPEVGQTIAALEYVWDAEDELQKAYSATVDSLKFQLQLLYEENDRLNIRLDQAEKIMDRAITRLDRSIDRIEKKAKD